MWVTFSYPVLFVFYACAFYFFHSFLPGCGLLKSRSGILQPMDSLVLTSHITVKCCSVCQGEVEYYCQDCKLDLCYKCRENHFIDLNTVHHYVTLYREKFIHPLKKKCARHTDQYYDKFCEPCKVLLCRFCSEHNTHMFSVIFPFSRRQRSEHKVIDLMTAFDSQKEIMHNILERIYRLNMILIEVKSYANSFHNQISCSRKKILLKCKDMQNELESKMKHLALRHRCLSQKVKMINHIDWIQSFEDCHEQSANRPVRFLRFIRDNHFSKVQTKIRLPKHYLLSLNQENNIEDLIEILSNIQITKRGMHHAHNEPLLTMMQPPVLEKFPFEVGGINVCKHISCESTDRVWVSDAHNIILRDIPTKESVHCVFDSLQNSRPDLPGLGLHTVNCQSELIYIDKEFNINKLSKDMKIKTIFIKTKDSLWSPQCVFYSPLTGDLLVGMFRQFSDILKYGLQLDSTVKSRRGRVVRFDGTGKQTQVIEHECLNYTAYIHPIYITENNNGDVVVSDRRGAVVVSNREGKHRFSYTGPPAKSGLLPYGICTDALSNILVCDGETKAVHMLDQDGNFLSFLLTTAESTGLNIIPFSLSYDRRTHLLFVGSGLMNTVFVYRHIKRVDSLHGKFNFFD